MKITQSLVVKVIVAIKAYFLFQDDVSKTAMHEVPEKTYFMS